MTKFETFKAKTMKKLENAKELQLVDKDAIPFLDEINAKENYFTSSSCYGRIYIMNIPNRSKKDAQFLGKWHRKVSFDEVKKVIDEYEGKMWFRMESMILHISCRDVESADKLLKVKSNAGIRRGGIFHIQPGRVQIEMTGTQKVDFPIKEGNKYLITDDYLKKVIEISNKKFDLNVEQWERLRKEAKKL